MIAIVMVFSCGAPAVAVTIGMAVVTWFLESLIRNTFRILIQGYCLGFDSLVLLTMRFFQ